MLNGKLNNNKSQPNKLVFCLSTLSVTMTQASLIEGLEGASNCVVVCLYQNATTSANRPLHARLKGIVEGHANPAILHAACAVKTHCTKHLKRCLKRAMLVS